MKFYAALSFLLIAFVLQVSSDVKVKKIKVYEHLWVGDTVDESYKTSVYVPTGAKLYDVMVEAEKSGDDYKFVAIDDAAHGKFITKIGENEQDPAVKKYWMIYITDKAPKKSSPPGPESLSPLAVGNLVVESRKHYLFWLKTVVF